VKFGAGSYALGYRLSWMFAWVAVAGFGLAFASVYLLMSAALDQKSSDELVVKSALVRHLLTETQDPPSLGLTTHKLDDLLVSHANLRVDVRNSDGTFLYQGRAPKEWSGDFRQAEYLFSRPDGKPPVTALLQIDVSADDRLLSRLAWILLALTLAGSLAVAAGAFWVVRVGLAPLRDLVKQTSELQADRLDQRLTASGQAHELVPWIGQLNSLLERLQRAYQQLEGFNADVAHELRTPLAVLITRSEVDLAGVRSAEHLRESMARSLEELQRLASIVNDMLFLSRADRGVGARLDPVASLAQHASEVLAFHEAELEEAELEARVEGDAVFQFDRRLVRRALSNLVSNAVRYAAVGSVVRVVVTSRGGICSIAVQNVGVPIADEVLTRLFDRFFRADDQREAVGEHHGLGLAIVAGIAKMHGGTPFADSQAGATTIGFTLPMESRVDHQNSC